MRVMYTSPTLWRGEHTMTTVHHLSLCAYWYPRAAVAATPRVDQPARRLPLLPIVRLPSPQNHKILQSSNRIDDRKHLKIFAPMLDDVGTAMHRGAAR